MKRGLLTLMIAAMSVASFAQKGYLRGKVIDGETGEGLIGATVSKQGTTIGTAADWDGNYSLALEPGVHTVVFQFVSYQTQTVNDVVITADEVVTMDITMGSATTELQEVVVTAEEIRDNEVALLSVQKKSANLVDGISSQTFRKVGDSDLSGAMKRVTGVSVQGGKYVYVRGLGDRYTKTTLNGMTIPGLDPDKNAVQMDIFPTSTIENVVVYKTFTPDLPGDFTGGIVDIETKRFPQEKTTSFSIGAGFNPDMHFKSNAVGYDGGGLDFAGFDDGTRAIPFTKSTDIPNVLAANGADAEGYTRAFDSQLAAKQQPNFMNYSLSFNHGNQIDKNDLTFGYNAVLNYKVSDEFYEGVEFGIYTRSYDLDDYNFNGENLRIADISKKEVMWNALLSGAVKSLNHTLNATLLRTQNGVSSASEGVDVNLDDNPSKLLADVLAYQQRSVTSGMLMGKHNLNKVKLEWKGALNWSRIYEPDFRVTRIEEKEDGSYGLNTGVGAGIDRFYRDLNENNQNIKADITYPFGEQNKLKVGGLASFKKRDFEVIEYFFRNIGDNPISSDVDEMLLSENIWTPATGEGMVAKGDGLNPAKTFEAKQHVYAGYAMSEMHLFQNWKAIYGVRAEQVMMYYTGRNQSNQVLSNENTLSELDILPSANLVYALSDDMNIRASFNGTIARPSFKEKSNAQIFDPISKITFIGNLDLEETHINNYDLRWEYFYGRGEMISISGFYKTFDGHIELTAFDTAPDQLTPRNSGNSTVLGVEIEFRKNITDRLALGVERCLH